MTEPYCSRYIYEGMRSWKCHRPAVEQYDGQWMCKPHLAGAKRSEAAAKQNREKWAAERTYSDRLREVAQSIGGNTTADYRGKVVITMSLERAEEIAALLAGVPA